jgi:hypothetical protein
VCRSLDTTDRGVRNLAKSCLKRSLIDFPEHGRFLSSYEERTNLERTQGKARRAAPG